MYSKHQTIKKALFWLLAAVVVLGFFVGNPFPNRPKQTWQVPTQIKSDASPFYIQGKEQSYYVEPMYDYQMQGVVVSKSQPRSALMADGDKDIKPVDLCIVWGDNLNDNLYQKMKYTSGDFTCFVWLNNREDGQKFNAEDFSNNHIITDSPTLFRKLRNIKIGDQVVVRGYLVKYGFNEKQIIRSSSISRTDTGNGACESIYIKSLEVIPRPFSKITMLQIACGIAMLMLVFMKRKDGFDEDD